MRRVMVRYTVKSDEAAHNQRLIEAVFAQLAAEQPGGLRYASFKLADGVSFMHIASVETDDGKNPLLAVEAFKAFTAKVADRCVQPPVTVELDEVGSYRIFDA